MSQNEESGASFNSTVRLLITEYQRTQHQQAKQESGLEWQSHLAAASAFWVDTRDCIESY